MKQKEKVYWCILLLVIIAVATLAAGVYWRNRDYQKTALIQLTGVLKAELPLDIPVIYITRRPSGQFQAFPLSDRSRKNYTLHWDPRTDELFISILRGEFGGWIIMNGDYRISDPTAKAKLLSFLKANHWE
ncbi:MAG: hypothetical protein AB7F32_01130 [Victivallaceae bacterium]